MSKTYLLLAALIATGCTTNNQTQNPQPTKPTGAPRQAKGKLPMSNPQMMPKSIAAVKEMGGKPMVATRSEVSASGTFDFTLDVGVRYMFIITLVDGSMMSLYASDATASYASWLPIGNPLGGGLTLDFGNLTIVQGVFVSTTVLTMTDWDGDGIADFADDDDDNDGIDDAEDFDIDGDGIEDDYLDADGDGECDLVDYDDDNDGIDDIDDTDDDGDGIDDDEDDDSDIDIDGDGDPDGDDTGDDDTDDDV